MGLKMGPKMAQKWVKKWVKNGSFLDPVLDPYFQVLASTGQVKRAYGGFLARRAQNPSKRGPKVTQKGSKMGQKWVKNDPFFDPFFGPLFSGSGQYRPSQTAIYGDLGPKGQNPSKTCPKRGPKMAQKGSKKGEKK